MESRTIVSARRDNPIPGIAGVSHMPGLQDAGDRIQGFLCARCVRYQMKLRCVLTVFSKRKMETQLYCQPGEHGASLSSGACVNYEKGGL